MLSHVRVSRCLPRYLSKRAMNVYTIKLIPIQRKEKMAERFGSQTPYEVKSDVYGCCIKLLTDRQSIATRWGQSFYFMSQNIRSHGRLYVVNDPEEEKNKVCYCLLYTSDAADE